MLGLFIALVSIETFCCYKVASASTNQTISRGVDASTRYKVDDDVTQLLGGQSQAIISTKGSGRKVLEQNHMEVLILLVLLDCLFHSPPMLK